MAAALALAERGRGRTAPNPSVGCVIVRDGHVVARGWTQPGGRPHAEAMALAEAADVAAATVYVTLEPCAHASTRGPACADLLVAARPDRVVVALGDPDPRTDGEGVARLRAAGISVEVGIAEEAARRSMAGFLTRQRLGRPHVTLKLATSLDGRIARPDGESRWITGARRPRPCRYR
jgi:diaminohydroxyphosphoribosylaminopyrimidine deaminase/5-amino-6-(5-phosphoribosylamino)uracil reductase